MRGSQRTFGMETRCKWGCFEFNLKVMAFRTPWWHHRRHLDGFFCCFMTSEALVTIYINWIWFGCHTVYTRDSRSVLWTQNTSPTLHLPSGEWLMSEFPFSGELSLITNPLRWDHRVHTRWTCVKGESVLLCGKTLLTTQIPAVCVTLRGTEHIEGLLRNTSANSCVTR